MSEKEIKDIVEKELYSDFYKEYIQEEGEKLFKLAYNMAIQKVYNKADYWIDGEAHISAQEILRLKI